MRSLERSREGGGRWGFLDLVGGTQRHRPKSMLRRAVPRRGAGYSSQEVFDDVAVDVGEAEVAAGVVIGEVFVVEAEEVKDGGLEVVDVDLFVSNMEAEVIGGTVGAGFGAAASHEGGEGLRVVVASGLAAKGGVGFDHGGASKFAAPDDEGFIEQAVAFEVLNERGGGLGGLFAVVLGAAFDVGMSVPPGVVDVDEADAALDHAAGEEAGAGEGLFVAVAAVEIDRFVGLGFEVHQFGGGTLEAGCHFVGGDAGRDFLVLNGVETGGVEFVNEIEGV